MRERRKTRWCERPRKSTFTVSEAHTRYDTRVRRGASSGSRGADTHAARTARNEGARGRADRRRWREDPKRRNDEVVVGQRRAGAAGAHSRQVQVNRGRRDGNEPELSSVAFDEWAQHFRANPLDFGDKRLRHWSGDYAVASRDSTKVACALAVACFEGPRFDIVEERSLRACGTTPMRFRLRYLQHDFEMGEGEFLIGRSPSCQLSLDDPLVSRRHALLIVTSSDVSTEDLGSRNGVLVNGQRINGRHTLNVGDRILIGAQEMTLLESKSEEQPGMTSTARLARLSISKIPKQALAPGTATASHFATAPPAMNSVNPREDTLQGPRRPVGGLSVIASVAEKSLSMNRVEEAERIISASLHDVLEQVRSGQHVGSEVVDLAARLAARLASATGKGAWVDYVVELYFREARPCPAPVIDELYIALRKVNAVQTQQLRDYVGRLRERVSSFGPAERFLFQRLEGLERLAGLRG